MEEKFDAIIVGAGPAGCACALKLAQSGIKVLVVERGAFAGAKNTWGGAFYGPELANLLPDFQVETPYERWVARHRISMLTDEDCLSIDYSSTQFSHTPYSGVILLRSKFDRWLSSKAEEAGAIIAYGLAADDLLWDNQKIAGIKAGDDALRADVVVACDGVNSILAQKAGLRAELKAQDVKQGVKEVIEFPRELLEQRFNLVGDEGIAWEFVGACTGGLPGGGFIYTNKESLSIGIVIQLNGLVEKQTSANDLLERFKQHPVVARLIEGGTLVEYSAHLIPVSGVSMMPKLYSNGMLVAGDAAAFVVVTGLVHEGANFAVASGIAAAKAIVKAKEKGDYSSDSLSYYQRCLEEEFVLKDLKTFSRAPHFLENNRIYTAYPELACSLANKIYINDGQPKKKAWQIFQESRKGKISLLQMARDLLDARRAL